jgi:hypothetical protein
VTTIIFLLVLDFVKCIDSTTSYKFTSYTKMLETLIRKSPTNSCLCKYLINKNKYNLMNSFLDEMYVLIQKASSRLGILVVVSHIT